MKSEKLTFRNKVKNLGRNVAKKAATAFLAVGLATSTIFGAGCDESENKVLRESEFFTLSKAESKGLCEDESKVYTVYPRSFDYTIGFGTKYMPMFYVPFENGTGSFYLTNMGDFFYPVSELGGYNLQYHDRGGKTVDIYFELCDLPGGTSTDKEELKKIPGKIAFETGTKTYSQYRLCNVYADSLDSFAHGNYLVKLEGRTLTVTDIIAGTEDKFSLMNVLHSDTPIELELSNGETIVLYQSSSTENGGCSVHGEKGHALYVMFPDGSKDHDNLPDTGDSTGLDQ